MKSSCAKNAHEVNKKSNVHNLHIAILDTVLKGNFKKIAFKYYIILYTDIDYLLFNIILKGNFGGSIDSLFYV